MSRNATRLRDQQETQKDRLYPYLLNASERNRQILLRTSQIKVADGETLRKSLSPFRWTNKTFALPLLREKTKQTQEPEAMLLRLPKEPQPRKRYSVNQTISYQPANNLDYEQDRLKIVESRHDRVRSRNLPTKPPASLLKSIEIRQGSRASSSLAQQHRFVFRSNDQHIRRALLAMGWAQTRTKGDFNFDLKWTNTDSPTEYNNLREGQYFNHILGSDELTDKGKLTANMARSEADFYPRTYDLSSQYYDFVNDFTQTGILCLLKRFVELIKLRNYALFCEPIQCCLGDVLKTREFVAEQSQQDLQLNIGLVMHLCLYSERLRKRAGIHYFEHDPSYREVDINIDEKVVQSLLAYSLGYSGVVNKHVEINKTETPSNRILSLLVLYDQLFRKYLPYYEFDGLSNVWILKPSSSSKGQGIELINKLDINLSRLQNRIAQKYVENCSLIKSWQQHPQLQLRKFDIREWVLVDSYSMTVYRFSMSYLRFCSQPYSLDKLKEQRKHLTNYYVNRGNFDSSEQSSVLPISELFQYLQQRQPHIQELYYRQLDKIIVETINSTQRLHRRKGCFELFGFDVLLDTNSRLWLLEVNLSPACEARTPWLEDMLSAMSQGLLVIVLPKHLAPIAYKNARYQWQKIYEQPEKELIQPTRRFQPSKVELEGSLMKEVRKKVIAKRLFTSIVEKYVEHFVSNTVHQLRQLRPISKTKVDKQYVRVGTIVKTLQVLINIRQRRSFQAINELAESRAYFEQNYGPDD